MNILSSKLLRIFALLLIVGVLVTQTNVLANILRPSSAYAVGDLTVTWDGAGTGDTGPIFTVSDMAPGDSETKTITIENGSSESRQVSIKGIETADSGDLSSAMSIVISQEGTDVYGGSMGTKTLTEFFEDSNDANGIALDTLTPGETKEYDIVVTFLENAGNDFQNQTLTFDLKIGIVIEVPEICSSIENLNIEDPIYGSEGSDFLQGTSGNDLIYGFEGADYINGRGGHDCIIGGAGSDYITGNNGNDILYGNEGADYISGGNGTDELNGGPGADALFGGSSNDILTGETGQDAAFGGSGSDTCTAQFTLQCESN